jgi:hypothetical protein
VKCWGYEWGSDPNPKVFNGHIWTLTKIQDGWLAKTSRGTVVRNSVSAAPEEALAAILGPPVRVGNLLFYPQEPEEDPGDPPAWRLYRGYHGPLLQSDVTGHGFLR